jgi:hypothetical protein
MDKTEYISRVRHYVDTVLLTDQAIALACEAGLDCTEVLDVLYPLVTKKGIPFPAQNLLYAACSDPRKTVAFLTALHIALVELDEWELGNIQREVNRVAESLGIPMDVAVQVCRACVLFGHSPLDSFSSMAAIGQDAACRRCLDAANLLALSLRVG